MPRTLLLTFVVAWCHAGTALCLDHVVLRREGQEVQLSGRVVLEADDGGLMLLEPDGVLWAVPAADRVKLSTDEVPFKPLPADEIGDRLLADLPPGFEIHETTHYLICHNTSRAYAQWCGALFERLYRGFTNYWSRRGFELHEPEFPLVAMVFANRESYGQYAQGELGDAVESIIGYYSLHTNRMTMYDLTGIQALRRPGDRRGSAGQINQMLARPEAGQSVATIIHEATHQIAFNCGLHLRYADVPLWVSEGIAVYFETPDLGSSKGWRTIGAVNRARLAGFRQYLAQRPAGSLESLIASDARLRDPRQAGDAYAEAWALTYFLLRQRPQQYLAYLKVVSQPRPIDAATKVLEFKRAFGEDLAAIDAEFLRHMARVR